MYRSYARRFRIVPIQKPTPIPIFTHKSQLHSLLRLLPPVLLGRFTPQPDRYERDPRRAGSPDAQNPNPSTTNCPTPRPFVVRKVSDRHFSLLINVGEERALIVHAEVEDTVLVWKLERSCVNGAGCCLRNRSERETVEG